MNRTDRRRTAGMATLVALTFLLVALHGEAARAELGNEVNLLPAQAGSDDRVGRSVALSGDGGTLILGAPAGFIGSVGPGAAYVYVRSADGWSQEAQLIPGDSSPVDHFGESVALSADGDTAVIGSWEDDGGPGSAYVFQRVGNSWLQQSKLGPDGGPQRYFGWSVGISADGGTIVLGSPTFEIGGAGSAYLFTGGGSGWDKIAKLSPGDTTDATSFGMRVAIDGDGDVVVVGNSSQDSVHLFAANEAGWSEVQQLTGADLGSAVDLSSDGGVLVAGASTGWTGSGYANVYRRTGLNWELRATLTAGEPENEDWFATSVAISAAGDAIAVGSKYSDVGAEADVGSAYFYERAGGAWSDGQKISPSDPTYNDEFGASLSLSDDGGTLLVGAHNKDFFQSPTYRGAAYVYETLPSVNGSANRLGSLRVQCTNRTTGQAIQFTTPGATWDCEAHGLIVNPGDRVVVLVGGTVE